MNRHKGLVHAVSDTAFGNLAFRYGDADGVRNARAAFLSRAGVSPERCIVMQVEHGERIIAVTGAEVGIGALSPEAGIAAEALMTNAPGLGLFLLTADCLPIAFYDPVRGVVALAHLGWKPTGLGLSTKVVHQMIRTYGCDPASMTVHIGPGIHAESYVFDTVEQAEDPAWQPFVEQDAWGKWHVDLVAANRAQLVAAGVVSEHISVDGANTAVSDKYFSHYRSARTGEPEARFATVVALERVSKNRED